LTAGSQTIRKSLYRRGSITAVNAAAPDIASTINAMNRSSCRQPCACHGCVGGPNKFDPAGQALAAGMVTFGLKRTSTRRQIRLAQSRMTRSCGEAKRTPLKINVRVALVKVPRQRDDGCQP
jgi:hypothetical protein